VSPQRVAAVVRKEVRDFRRNRFVVWTMAVLPVVFLITPMVTLFRIPASASGPEVRSAVGAISLLLLIVPIVIPPVIAAYSVVGERDQGTLEPVLTAPLRPSELLLGKAIAAFLPSIAISYAVYFIVAISIRLGAAHVVSAVVWRPNPTRRRWNHGLPIRRCVSLDDLDSYVWRKVCSDPSVQVKRVSVSFGARPLGRRPRRNAAPLVCVYPG
jgi:ABC-type Na+ efflux pump permease subunit